MKCLFSMDYHAHHEDCAKPLSAEEALQNDAEVYIDTDVDVTLASYIYYEDYEQI